MGLNIPISQGFYRIEVITNRFTLNILVSKGPSSLRLKVLVELEFTPAALN